MRYVMVCFGIPSRRPLSTTERALGRTRQVRLPGLSTRTKLYSFPFFAFLAVRSNLPPQTHDHPLPRLACRLVKKYNNNKKVGEVVGFGLTGSLALITTQVKRPSCKGQD